MPIPVVALELHAVQEIARYHPIFGFYLVIPLPPQVLALNSSPAVPILTPIPRSTLDHGIETLLTSLSFCPTLLPIWINFPTSTLVLSGAQTPANGQATNLLPPAMLGMQDCGRKRSRGGRKSCAL